MTLPAPHFRSIPTQEILEGLARLHPFVLLADRAGRVEWMSGRLRERLCADPELAALGAAGHDHLLESFIAHLPHPEQLDALREDLRSRGRASRVLLDIGTPHGTQLGVDASAFAVGGAVGGAAGTDPGEPRHYVVIARPLDEARRNQQIERESFDMLSQIADRSPHGMVATDRSGYVRYANPRAAALLGHPRETLAGRPIAAVLPSSHAFADLLLKLREPTGWDGEEIERVDAQGRSSWLSVSTRPLQDAEGCANGVIVYLRDATDAYRQQQQLERKNQELEGYVDSVAHDLRSPLVSLLGFTRLLQQDYEDVLDETGRHFLDRVEQAGRTMDGLIHHLLELARIRKPAELQSLTDPRRVLQQVEAELKLRLEENEVVLVLPEAPPMMRVDATRLYQVVSNLVGNALVHGLANGPGRVEIEVIEGPDHHELVVSDDGRGIPEEEQERIFEVFHTGRGVRRCEHSNGIGLAIVKKIAEAQGGRVWVESAAGLGARFHVLFPSV